jgi:hypothetical protein
MHYLRVTCVAGTILGASKSDLALVTICLDVVMIIVVRAMLNLHFYFEEIEEKEYH